MTKRSRDFSRHVGVSLSLGVPQESWGRRVSFLVAAAAAAVVAGTNSDSRREVKKRARVVATFDGSGKKGGAERGRDGLFLAHEPKSAGKNSAK